MTDDVEAVATDVEAVVTATFREEWSRVVATLIRTTGDWDFAEECAQDAFAQALARWPADGVPRRPGAWIVTTARNRAVDRIRRRAVEGGTLRKLARAAESDDSEALFGDPFGDAGRAGELADDRLRLLFTCCHPALSLEARVALTLRTVAGLSTAEIARSCLVSEATMAKRLVRAKSRIRHAGIPYRVPSPDQLPARTSGVLAVLYLLFNEGYAATDGADPVRADLCGEAIRLARLVAGLLATDPEPAGLLALMLLHHSRREARSDPAGRLLTLEEQDRRRWRRAEIDDGVAVLEAALERGSVGPYQLQALIGACHATAGTAADTDWAGIARLYRRLMPLVPSPVVALNHAVAVAMSDGPAAGLALVDDLAGDARLAGYHLLPATRADLLRRLGRTAEAAAAYRAAIPLADAEPVREYLRRRLGDLPGDSRDGVEDAASGA